MSVPFASPNTYSTFNQWMADTHSLVSRIQHEIDGVELSGGDSDFIDTEALGQLIEMTEAFAHLLSLGDKESTTEKARPDYGPFLNEDGQSDDTGSSFFSSYGTYKPY